MRLRIWKRSWGSPGGFRSQCHVQQNLPLQSQVQPLLQFLRMKASSGCKRKISGGHRAGKMVRKSTGASSQDVPFEVPTVQPGEKDCQLCHQSFKSTSSLRHHMKTHTGETGWSCSSCNKILASRAMQDLHLKSCEQEKGHWCRECNREYTTKQALVAHLKAKHGPPPSVVELTCPTCGKILKIVKAMREHLATDKGPFHC